MMIATSSPIPQLQPNPPRTQLLLSFQTFYLCPITLPFLSIRIEFFNAAYANPTLFLIHEGESTLEARHRYDASRKPLLQPRCRLLDLHPRLHPHQQRHFLILDSQFQVLPACRRRLDRITLGGIRRLRLHLDRLLWDKSEELERRGGSQWWCPRL